MANNKYYPTILKVGDYGEAVKKMQELLIAQGYSCGVDGADGDFGPNTLSAVIKYQKAHGLEADGEYGPLSRASLESGKAETVPAEAPAQSTVSKPTVVIPSTNGNASSSKSSGKYTASRLLEIAAAEIGYHEKVSNAYLDSNTANSGSGNWTKYARDLYNAGFFNGNKNGYAWCAVYVTWCFWQLAGKDREKSNYIQCQTGDCGAGCSFSAQYYKDLGRFYTSNPQPGDQIFFRGSGTVAHTGLVESVAGGYVVTIEGNTSDQVARRTYTLGNGSIYGYGRPRLDPEE